MQRVVPGSVMSGTTTPVACGRTLAATTAGGLEVRVCRLDRQVLVEDAQEAPEVGVAPLPAGPFALLDDRVDGQPRGGQVGDRDQLRPSEVLLGGLGVRRPDEQALRAEAPDQVLEAGLDRSVELADRVELLEMGDDLVGLVVGQCHGLLDRLEPLGVLDVHPLGPLEEGEMTERGLTERQQLDPDAGRIAVRRHREVRAGEARRGADGRQQVLDQREVEHLLLADAQQRLAPALDRGERLGRQPFIDGLLE